MLERGRRVTSGAVAEVITRDHVAAVYGVELLADAGYSFRALEGRR